MIKQNFTFQNITFMKLNFLFIVVLFIASQPVKTQESTILDQYISQGLDNNLALKQKNLNLEKSIEALKEANGLFFPSVEINSQYILSEGGRYVDLPVGDMLNPVYSSLNQILQNMGEPGNFPQIDNQKIQFLPTDYHDTKFQVVLPLINAEIYYNRKIKKEMISYTQAEINVFKRELVKEIKTAYLRYLQSIKVVEALDGAKELVKEALRVNERLAENQMAGKDQLLRIKAELSHVDAQLTKAKNDQKTASYYFNFLINQPLKTNITVDSVILQNEDTRFIVFTDSLTQSREELLQLKNAENAAGLNLNMKRSYWIPSISNVTDLGYQGTEYKFNSDQRYVMNIINLRWTIFEGGQNKHKISQARIDQDIIDQKLTETEQQIELQQQLARNSLETSIQAELADKSSLSSSMEYFKVVSSQYAQGQKSLLDLLDARNQLTNSRINYSVSHFETLIRLAGLERAIGSYDLK